MRYREFNLEAGTDIALRWASSKSEDDAYIFVLELFQDINAHSENKELMAKFGEPDKWWLTGDSPYSEVANAIKWDIDDAITIAYEVMYEVGRDDIARFILTL
tara:strand:- start:446 stop:754 length:309 start_codon:yes stop_codon:yes gene_type:complete